MPLDSSPGAAPYVNQGVTMLAAQPALPSRSPKEETAEWWVIYNHLERRREALRSWRWTWWSTWLDLGSFFLPRRVKYFVTPNVYNRGRFLNDQIIDSTGVQAMNTCASGMWSGLTNPARPWFRFGLAIETDLDQDAKDWLSNLQARVMAVLHGSNFYSTTAQFFQDVTVFGTSPIIIYEDDENIIRCYLPCAGEYFLQAGSRLSVDTLYREFTFTVGQIVEMFKLANCPIEIQKMWEEGQYEREYVVCHAIEPNFGIAGRGRKSATIRPVPSHYPFREVYWLKGMKTTGPLSMNGFHERPFMVGRWWIVSNDAYGRSPCMDALGDNKQIQTETLRKAEFLEKGVRPPMLADPELKNEPASIMPGMVTFVNTANSKAGFKPAFQVQAQWIQYMTADIKDVQQRIKEALYIPQFLAISQMQGVQPRNELELTKRDLERLQVLGPVIDLFENEVASPAIERIIAIMERRGLVPPMPDSLRGRALKIQYQSLARLAQRAAESVAMKDGFVTMGELSAAAKAAELPDPMRKINLEKSLEHYLFLNNYPDTCIYTDQEVKQHDDARAQAVAQVKQEQAASAATKPAVDAAKVLANTEVGGGSYLNSLLGGSATPS